MGGWSCPESSTGTSTAPGRPIARWAMQEGRWRRSWRSCRPALIDPTRPPTREPTSASTRASFFGEAILPRGTTLTRDDLDRLDTTRPISGAQRRRAAPEADRRPRRLQEVHQGLDRSVERQDLLQRRARVPGADGGHAARTTSTRAAPTPRSGDRERSAGPIRPAREQGRASLSSTRPAGKSTSTQSATAPRAKPSTTSKQHAIRTACATCATRSPTSRRSTRWTSSASRVSA